MGCLGGSVGSMSVFGSGHDLGALGSSSSLLSREPASPSASPLACALYFTLSLSNKSFSKIKGTIEWILVYLELCHYNHYYNIFHYSQKNHPYP